MQEQTQVLEQCGCSNIVGAGEEEEEEASETFPVCYLCGPPSATITNPDSVLSLPPFLGYPPDFTCLGLSTKGLDGLISVEGCSIMQEQTQVLEQCGCSNLVDNNDNAAAAAEIPPCFLCGSVTDIITNPEFVVGNLLPPFLGYAQETTCADIDRLGRDERRFDPAGCGLLQSQTEIRDGCCNSIGV